MQILRSVTFLNERSEELLYNSRKLKVAYCNLLEILTMILIYFKNGI